MVLDSLGRGATEGLECRYWEQLIQGSRTKKGLGARIRELLERNHPERLDEFDALGAEAGIDAGSPEDCERLLSHVSDDEAAAPLVSLLERRQRAALERAARPRAPKSMRPFSELARVVAEMVAERDSVAEAQDDLSAAALRVVPRASTAENALARGVFAWLFGPTLQEIAGRVSDESLSLEISQELMAVDDLRDLQQVDEEDDDEVDSPFAPLELKLYWSDGVASEKRIEWNPNDTPGLVALWRLSARPEIAYWAPPHTTSFHEWLDATLDNTRIAGGKEGRCEDTRGADIVGQWDCLRRNTLRDMRNKGLVASVIREYVSAYACMLERLRADHVPAGAGRPEVEEFLRRDFFIGKGCVACLATHPLRLRWIAAYLDRMAELIERGLRRELTTNPVNPSLFFEKILDVSPQSQPPVTVCEEQLMLAVREQDWHEIYAPLKDARGEKREWLADLDNGAIDEIAETIGRYLEAYPHKADGLHLLYVVRRYGARGLHRLVKKVLEYTGHGAASLTLSLFVDADEVRAVEDLLQEFDDRDHRAFSNRPPLLVHLYNWREPDEGLPDLSSVRPFVDIAVVPNLFGAATRTQESTITGGHQLGAFDTLLDEPTRLEAVRSGAEQSSAVSRVLLPEGRDGLLEAWSTVVTRHFRGAPVSDSPSADDIDHVTIRVSMDRNRAFFDDLHICAHWVITVDAFVGREQVEALDGGPDVIQVKTGVGANGAYRMVVSSKVGREFVQARLARRLREQLSPEALPDPASSAVEIYDRGRLLVPGIVLRSLGLGRTTAEMVGLVLARYRIEQVDPALVAPYGFQSWISLDEHSDWSGGHTKGRADLVRFRGRVVDGCVKLRVDIVEAKMRPDPPVGQADAQLNRSLELFGAALGGAGDVADCVDTEIWSRLFWRAIEQSASAADGVPAATHVVTPDGRRAGIDPLMQAAIREGKCEVESVTGIFVSLTNNATATDDVTPSGHRWLKMTFDEVAVILSGLVHNRDFPLHEYNATSVPEPSNAMQEVDASRTSETAASRSTRNAPVLTTAKAASASFTKDDQVRGGATSEAKQRLQELVDALHARRIEVRPAPDEDAVEGPGFYRLRVVLGPGVRPQTVSSLTEDLQYQLGLEAGQTPRLYVDRGAMVVEIPKREHERYYVSAHDMWQRFEWPADRLVAPIGCDVQDRPIAVDFSSSRSPHLLIGGMTGGGKSIALEVLLLGLVRHYEASRLELRIVDPKGTEFTQFEDLPHVSKPLGADANDAIRILGETCEEMDRRYRSMKELSQRLNARVRDITTYNSLVPPGEALTWVVVVLDEYADLTAERDDKRLIESLVQRLAQKDRACGIHMIVATQKPSAEVISTTTRSNLGAQLALRVRSAIDSKVIMETNGAESLAGNGDGFLRLAGEEPIRIQCARAD